MFYVDDKGKLKHTEESIKVKSIGTFFIKDELFEFSMLNPYIANFCKLHRMVDFLLQSNYKAHIDKVSRTEKNKGGEYASSAYTVTAGLEKIKKESIDIKKESIDIKKEIKLFNSHLYTFRGASDNFLKIYARLDPRYFFNSCLNPDSELLEALGKDTQLYQKSRVGEVEIILTFCPIKVYGYREGFLELDSLDCSTYLSFLTKFMEMMGNIQFVKETEEYKNRYELWLFYVFRKYFKFEFLDKVFEV